MMPALPWRPGAAVMRGFDSPFSTSNRSHFAKPKVRRKQLLEIQSGIRQAFGSDAVTKVNVVALVQEVGSVRIVKPW